jgi:iodotyrosine deiodinase
VGAALWNYLPVKEVFAELRANSVVVPGIETTALAEAAGRFQIGIVIGISLGTFEVSDDSRLLAYTTDNVGFRQYKLHIKDLRTGRLLRDTAERVDRVAWAADSKTLFYAAEDAQTKRSDKVYTHLVGSSAADDRVVFDEKEKRYAVAVDRTRDGRYLLIDSSSHVTTEVRFMAADSPSSSWKILQPRAEGIQYYVDEGNELFYIRVNDTEPSFQARRGWDRGCECGWATYSGGNLARRFARRILGASEVCGKGADIEDRQESTGIFRQLPWRSGWVERTLRPDTREGSELRVHADPVGDQGVMCGRALALKRGHEMADRAFVTLPDYREYSTQEMKRRAAEFHAEIRRRRTVRDFSDRHVPREIIESCLLAAGTAPSGANLQPWHFVVVSDPALKKKIRDAAEKEEYEFYHGKAPKEWLDALAPLGTNEHKPFLENAPYLIVIFAQSYGVCPDGRKVKHYYAQESVGIATGIMITAIHHAGLASLTHTPSPMGFLNELLGRPPQERPFLILVVGFPAPDASVPAITKRSLDEIATFL